MKRVSRPLAAPDLAAQIPGPTLAEGRHQGALRALRLTPRCCTGDTPTWFPRLVTARMASKGPDRGVSLRTPHCLCRRGTWPSPRTPSSLSHLDYQQLPAISPPAPSITPPPPPPSSPPQFHPPPTDTCWFENWPPTQAGGGDQSIQPLRIGRWRISQARDLRGLSWAV